jgi:hypothetical protein
MPKNPVAPASKTVPKSFSVWISSTIATFFFSEAG